MRAADRFRLMPAHLARRHAASLLIALNPDDDRAHRHRELGRSLVPRQPAFQNRSHNPLTKIRRIRLSHPC